MLQVYQEHHDLEFELLDKAKSEQELRESIYYNKIYTHNVSTTTFARSKIASVTTSSALLILHLLPLTSTSSLA